jgi:hypothetical protein
MGPNLVGTSSEAQQSLQYIWPGLDPVLTPRFSPLKILRVKSQRALFSPAL